MRTSLESSRLISDSAAPPPLPYALLGSLGIHATVVLAAAFFFRTTDLAQLLASGETLAFTQENEAQSATLEMVDEIPPPPPVSEPEFVKPEVIRLPLSSEIPKPKPKIIPELSPVVKPARYANSLPLPGNVDFPRPLYPLEARIKHYQGTVTLRIAWDATGRVVEAKVLESSGHPILDTNARSWVLSRWNFRNFSPGTNGEVIVPYTYQLSG